ncbi:MAG: arginine--tRNA ligase [Candidatus Nealsonbacteria bacterium]|nr:arginine--tRNA ligase [Candidatus Nealsonbacteria bacterium]
MQQELVKIITQAAKQAGFSVRGGVNVDYPQETYGDYATNFALQAAKTVKLSPKTIANNLRSHILNLRPDLFDKVEVAEPGFLNFFIAKKYLQDQVKEIVKQKEKYGEIKTNKQKINIEYCSANPTGPLHLGHGRGAFWGDTLANVFDKAGHKTTREYFINDYGKQILLFGESINARWQELLGQKPEIKEEFYKGEYVKDIARELMKKEEHAKLSEAERIKVFADIGLKKMLAETKALLEKAGVKYDVWFSERTLYKKDLVKKAIELLKKKGFTYEKEGALWFSSSKLGDDKDRVLKKANGEETYFASDIAYHLNKISRKYDLLIDGWGADHWGYKMRLMAAAKVLGFEEKLKIVVGQFVRLVENGQEVKMSKRGGVFFTLEELFNEVGPDVARFFFLMKSVDTHIDFNLDLAKEQSQKNPVYYIQYAHARISSILLKAGKSKSGARLNLLRHPSELKLIKELLKFPDVIEDTSKDYQVQRLPQYAVELATSFHKFYQDCQVIPASPAGRSKDKNLSQARLVLTLAAKIVLKNTLELMGVSAPEKM